jgi:heme A synthase
VIAYLLFFHAIAIAMAVGRRAGESAAVKRVVRIAAALVIVQLVLGASMVLMQLHGHLRMTHQAIGVAVWLVLFLATYLARVAQGNPRPTELAS